jgi:hypothetical protein
MNMVEKGTIWLLVDTADETEQILQVGFESGNEARETADAYHPEVEARSHNSLDEIRGEYSDDQIEWIENNIQDEESIRCPA